MNELLLATCLYLVLLGFYLWARSPKIFKALCPQCDALVKVSISETCKCGQVLSWVDRASEMALRVRDLEKLGMVKRVKLNLKK